DGAYGMPVTISVLVPDNFGVNVLSAVEGVHAVRYIAGQPLPPEAEHAEVLVPGFLSRDHIAALFAGMPALRYIHLLSAGAENWINSRPDGVLLSTCRGAHGGSTAEWVVGGLLVLYREFDRFIAARAQEKWDFHETDTLQDKRILIVGAGDLGDQL